MRTKGTTIVVFDDEDIEWVALFLLAYLERTKERKAANSGHPVNRRLAEEQLKRGKVAAQDTVSDQELKLLKWFCKALAGMKIDLKTEEFVGKKHIFMNLIANSGLKRALGPEIGSLDKYLTDIQKELLKFVAKPIGKDDMREWLAENGCKILNAIFANNDPAKSGVRYADGNLMLNLEPKIQRQPAEQVRQQSGSVPWMSHFGSARITTYNPITKVHEKVHQEGTLHYK